MTKVSTRACLLSRARSVEAEDAPTADHLWEIPLPTSAPSRMVELVHHAERFSCAAKGAALLYNLMLAERRDRSDDERDGDNADLLLNHHEIHDWALWASDVDLPLVGGHHTANVGTVDHQFVVRLPLGTRGSSLTPGRRGSLRSTRSTSAPTRAVGS